MSCNESLGYSINKGEIYRLANDLDGFKVDIRRGMSGETHYFIVLSHLKYNKKFSKKSFLAVGLSSSHEWPYSEGLIPLDHFDGWNTAVNRYGYYSLFYKASEIFFETDKVVRLCQEDIESYTNASPVLSLSPAGLNKVVNLVSLFLKMSNDDPN